MVQYTVHPLTKLSHLVASHGRVPAAGFASQFNARPSYASEGASCPLGLTVRSPGSWLGGSWVSALLIGIVFLHLHWDLAVMSGWLVLLSARSFLNSSVHKLPILTEYVHQTGVTLVLFCVCFGPLFGFVLLAVRLHPGVDSRLRNGPRSLLTPQCGTLRYATFNSFIGTNTVTT